MPKRISTIEHLPPQSLEAEEGILASCLTSQESCDEVVDILIPDHFYRSSHAKIFSAIIELNKKKEPVDLVTVSNLLRSKGELEVCGGATYLASLIDNIPVALNIIHYAEILRDKAAKRLTIKYCNDISQKCFSDSDPAIEIIDDAQTKILSIEMNNPGKVTYLPMSEIMMDAIDTIDDRFRNKGKITGVPTGFHQIDELTWGLQNTDLIIIAARPSMGKTSLALNIARHAAIDQEIQFPVGLFSMEMSKQQLSFKFLADMASINTQKFKSGYFSIQEWHKLTNAASKLADAPICIDDSSSLTISEVRRRARQMWKRNGIKLLIVDYLQLMMGSGEQNREREISEISKGLKGLGKDLNIPVIALSQLNRKLEDRTDKVPHLSDLRESGSLEQDGDVVIFVYRDEVYNKDENNPKKGTADIIIAKNRTGPLGMARLAFVDKFASFYNLSNQSDSY